MKKIIELYCNICQCNDSRFVEGKQRQSNNNCPKFSDEELITVYLWGKAQQLLTRKAIYNYTKEHLLDLFPKLPSYQAFCRRLNRLAPAFRALAEIWSEQTIARTEQTSCYVVDSCPIMLARHSRSNRGKVAPELCRLCRNPTRNEWYFGVKLHVFGMLRPQKLPVPCAMYISSSSLCDLWAAKQIFRDCSPISNGTLLADRAYIDADWAEELMSQHNVRIVIPRKKQKYDTLCSRDAVSTRISSLRQPIESLFHWINTKSGIQDASHVRSLEGLLFHVFASLAFACLLLRFYY